MRAELLLAVLTGIGRGQAGPVLSCVKEQDLSSPKVLYACMPCTVPGPAIECRGSRLDPLELLTYAPQPRRSLNVITQASPGYRPSQPTTLASHSGPHGRSGQKQLMIQSSPSAPGSRLKTSKHTRSLSSLSERAPNGEDPAWPVPPVQDGVAHKLDPWSHAQHASPLTSSASSGADRQGWGSRSVRPWTSTRSSCSRSEAVSSHEKHSTEYL